MGKSDLRLLLEDEFAALEEPLHGLECGARDFWFPPEGPALSAWGQLPLMDEIPMPPAAHVPLRR